MLIIYGVKNSKELAVTTATTGKHGILGGRHELADWHGLLLAAPTPTVIALATYVGSLGETGSETVGPVLRG